MDSQGRMRELVLHFTKDPEWLRSVTQDITDAIHAELGYPALHGVAWFWLAGPKSMPAA